MEEPVKRHITKQDQKRENAATTTEIAMRSIEKERQKRAEKTERLRAIRLAQQAKDQ